MASLKPTTRLPSLDATLASPDDHVAIRQHGSSRDVLERSILTAQLSPVREDASGCDHDRVLRAFAQFVLDFTGEEEIIYEFITHHLSQDLVPDDAIGVVHATAQDAPRTTAPADAKPAAPSR